MAQIQCLSQILTGEILRHGTENGQTEQGTVMPDQSDLERKRQMYNTLCVNDTAAYCCDLKNVANLMTEDHVFCDTANNRIKGKDNNIVQAWEPFFNFYPGYRNIFENIVARGSTVIMQGYSICSDEILNNICAIWVAKIIDNKVGSWHIYPDTKENREIFDL